jgi:hypothetical protein
MDVRQVSNDGFAFGMCSRRLMQSQRITREATSFNFLPDAPSCSHWRRRSGWNESNPSYEEIYDRDQKVGTLSRRAGRTCSRRCSVRGDLATGERDGSGA